MVILIFYLLKIILYMYFIRIYIFFLNIITNILIYMYIYFKEKRKKWVHKVSGIKFFVIIASIIGRWGVLIELGWFFNFGSVRIYNNVQITETVIIIYYLGTSSSWISDYHIYWRIIYSLLLKRWVGSFMVFFWNDYSINVRRIFSFWISFFQCFRWSHTRKRMGKWTIPIFLV